MNRRLVGFVLLCVLSLLWSQALVSGADAAKSMSVSRAPLAHPSLLPAPPPPANDDFANATIIVGNSGTVAGSNVGATPEVGEPTIPALLGNPASTSVWWSWTASFTGNATFDTFGTGFDTLLAAYTGTNVASLTEIASDDDVLAVAQSQVVFPVVTGTTYHIAVDSFNAAISGTITLNWAQAPAAPVNDLFANATAISGASGTTTGTTLWATREVGEPHPATISGGGSDWWSWTAPSDGFVAFDTFGSDYDTILGVYTGASVTSLTEVASNDDSTSGSWSLVTFPAAAGKTYMVVVDGFFGKRGNVVLNWTPVPVPPNDNFANAIALPGNSGQVAGSNVGATLEPGEPAPLGGSSVWWSWTAPTTGALTIDLVGSDFDTVLGVYTGTTVTALTQIAFNDDFFGLQSRVDFLAVTGTTYHIDVDGFGGGQGFIVLNYALDSTTHTLTYTAGPHGSITGATPQVVFGGQDGTPVTAVPDATYFLKQWSDGSTANPRQDTNVTNNVAVTAIFAQKFLVQFGTDGTLGATLDGATSQTLFSGDNSQPVTARAPAGFRFTDWTLNAGPDSAFNPLIVYDVAQPMACVAHFVPWSGYTGQVGVVNLTSGGLELLDPVTQSLHGPYFAGPGYTGLYGAAITPDGKTALAANFVAQRILFADLSNPLSPALAPTSVTLPIHPEDIALTPDAKYALVSDGGATQRIEVIDVPSRTLAQDVLTSVTGNRVVAVAVAVDGQTVLTADYNGHRIDSYLLNPASGMLTHTGMIDTQPYYPINIDISPDGKTAIVANASTTSSTILGANPLVLRIDGPGAVTNMGAVPLPIENNAAQSVLFARRTGDMVYYYATRNTSGTITNEIDVLDVTGPGQVSFSGTAITLAGFTASGGGWFGVNTLAIEPSGRYLYASNMANNPLPYLAVVDLLTNTEVSTIPVAAIPGSIPTGVAFPAWDLCHVAFQTDGTPGASLTGNTSQTLVAWTETTPVTANVPSGYHFVSWSGDIPTTTSNPLTVRPVAANLIVTANFAPNTGTVVVNVTPAGAPWSFTDGVAGVHSGTGPTTVTAVPTGSIALTWLPLAGYAAPAAPTPQTLASGGTVTFSGAYTLIAGTGAVRVTIEPAGAVAAGAQWRLVTATTTTLWLASGQTEAGLAPGSVTVEFNAVLAWTSPANQNLAVVAGQTTVTSGTYTTSPTGGLQIAIEPPAAVAAGAQWRRVGTTPYFGSGVTEFGVASGTYAVEFKPVVGWTVPADLTGLVVLTGQVTTGTATYTVSATGGLQITIGPAPAVAAGAQWRRMGTTPYFASGVAELGITPGTYAVEFKPITGWAVPANLTGLVVLTGQTTQGTGTYTQLLGGAPGDYKVSYKNCTIVADATHRGLIVTGANAATIKIQKLKKVPTKHADVPGKTLYMLGSPGLDFLTATGTIKSLSGTGAFIPAVTADVTGSIKMGVADASFAAPATSILSATSGTLPAGPALKISLSGVSLNNLVTSEAAAIKIGAKKTKGGTVPANVPAGAQILVGPGLSLGVTGGDMLADLVESTGGIASLSVKGGNFGQVLTSATLATFLTPAAVAVVQHPSTVVVSGLHSGPSDATADGIGKISAGTIHGVFVAGADEVGGLVQPSCDAAIKSWKATSASGDAFESAAAKTQPAGIVEHLTAP